MILDIDIPDTLTFENGRTAHIRAIVAEYVMPSPVASIADTIITVRVPKSELPKEG